MIDPFVGRRTLTPEQWKTRGEAIQARLQGLLINELMRGTHGAETLRGATQGLRRGGYDPNQPRVPAGHSDGGQWTDDDRRAGIPYSVLDLRLLASFRQLVHLEGVSRSSCEGP